jgi:aryl-alcohol dehydrogenase (NADP+)
LRRLQTDRIDLYYLHRDDPDTPLEETVSAIGDLIAQGKILHFGVSNFRGWRIAEVVRLCDVAGIDRPIGAQPYYNAVNRLPEVEYLPACAHYGIGVVPYSPLARGVLTGKYVPDEIPPPESRLARNDARLMATEFRSESLRIAQMIRDRAAASGMTAGQFAFNWVINHKQVAAAVAGPRTLAQWQENLGALAFELTDDDEAFIDSLVVPGHPSTPGYVDPKYPVTGRVSRSAMEAR